MVYTIDPGGLKAGLQGIVEDESRRQAAMQPGILDKQKRDREESRNKGISTALAQAINVADRDLSTAKGQDDFLQQVLEDNVPYDDALSFLEKTTKIRASQEKSPVKELESKKNTEMYYDYQEQYSKAVGSEKILDKIDKDSERVKLIHGGPWFSKKSAAALKARSAAALGPVLSILTKGQIPQGTLKMIADTHSINPWDSESKAKGKTSALRDLNKEALHHSKTYIDMYEKYDGNVPRDAMAKWRNGLSDFADKAGSGSLYKSAAKKEKSSGLSSLSDEEIQQQIAAFEEA